jgi:hypothetical protein
VRRRWSLSSWRGDKAYKGAGSLTGSRGCVCGCGCGFGLGFVEVLERAMMFGIRVAPYERRV